MKEIKQYTIDLTIKNKIIKDKLELLKSKKQLATTSNKNHDKDIVATINTSSSTSNNNTALVVDNTNSSLEIVQEPFDLVITTYNTGITRGIGVNIDDFVKQKNLTDLIVYNSKLNFPHVILIQEIKIDFRNSNYTTIKNQPLPNIDTFNKRKAKELQILYNNDYFECVESVQTAYRFQIIRLKPKNNNSQLVNNGSFVVINMHLPKNANKKERDTNLFIYFTFLDLLQQNNISYVSGGDFNENQDSLLSWRKDFIDSDNKVGFMNYGSIKTTKGLQGKSIDHVIAYNNDNTQLVTAKVFDISTEPKFNHKAVRICLAMHPTPQTIALDGKNSTVTINKLYQDAVDAWEDFKSNYRFDVEITEITSITTTTITNNKTTSTNNITTTSASASKINNTIVATSGTETTTTTNNKTTTSSGKIKPFSARRKKNTLSNIIYDNNSTDDDLLSEFNRRVDTNTKRFIETHYKGPESNIYSAFLDYKNYRAISAKLREICRSIIIEYLNKNINKNDEISSAQ